MSSMIKRIYNLHACHLRDAANCRRAMDRYDDLDPGLYAELALLLKKAEDGIIQCEKEIAAYKQTKMKKDGKATDQEPKIKSKPKNAQVTEDDAGWVKVDGSAEGVDDERVLLEKD